MIKDTVKFVRESSPLLILLVVVIFFAKIYLERSVESMVRRVEIAAEASAGVKADIRNEERKAIIEYREALEKWEDFLQAVLFDFTMSGFADDTIADLYRIDRRTYLNVKIAVVKLSIYLRSYELERELMKTVGDIRKKYYPLFGKYMPGLIDIKKEIALCKGRAKGFLSEDVPDRTRLAQSKEEADRLAVLENKMNGMLEAYSRELVKEYRPIAVQLDNLKQAANAYVYRPLDTTDLDKD